MEENIKLPPNLCFEVDEDEYGKGMEQFCEKIYPSLARRFNEDGYFQDRAILAPTNHKKEAINDHLMNKLPTEEVVLLSADSTVQPGDAALHPVEVLNTLNPQGLPKHRLTLRPGAILRLMRNLNPRDGLCNGTRMVFVGVLNGKVGISINASERFQSAGDALQDKRQEYARWLPRCLHPPDISIPQECGAVWL